MRTTLRFPIYFMCCEVKSFIGKNKHITEFKKQIILKCSLYLVKLIEQEERGGGRGNIIPAFQRMLGPRSVFSLASQLITVASWVLKNSAGYKSWHAEGILTHCLLVL